MLKETVDELGKTEKRYSRQVLSGVRSRYVPYLAKGFIRIKNHAKVIAGNLR